MSNTLDHPDVTALALGEPQSTTRHFEREDGLALELVDIRHAANLIRVAFAAEDQASLADEQRHEILGHVPTAKVATVRPSPGRKSAASMAGRRQRWLPTSITVGAAAAVVLTLMSIKKPAKPVAGPSESYARFEQVTLLDNSKEAEKLPVAKESPNLAHESFLDSILPRLDKKIDLGPVSSDPLHKPDQIVVSPPDLKHQPVLPKPAQLVKQEPVPPQPEQEEVQIPEINKSGKPGETEFAGPKPKKKP